MNNISPSLRGAGGERMQSPNKENHYLYNKHLREKAKSLRSNMTKAEACLWKYVLKGKSLGGFQFRRQRPVLNYIADFMCKELLLIVEVDGITHTHENRIYNDIKRQKELENAGFTLLRFTDEEILTNINNVQQKLIHWISGKGYLPPPKSPASGGQ